MLGSHSSPNFSPVAPHGVNSDDLACASRGISKKLRETLDLLSVICLKGLTLILFQIPIRAHVLSFCKCYAGLSIGDHPGYSETRNVHVPLRLSHGVHSCLYARGFSPYSTPVSALARCSS